MWLLAGAFATGLPAQGLRAAARGVAPGGWESTRVSALDVGLGTAVVVTLEGGETWLYDCGSSRYADVGGRVVAPYLWRQGVRRVEGVLLSHPDRDHVSGVLAVVERFAVGAVYVDPTFGATEAGRLLLERIAERGVPVREVRAGDRVGGVFTVLGPRPSAAGGGRPSLRTDNDRSLVVRLDAPGGARVLLAGDIEEPGTAALLAGPPDDLRCEVLLVPHHGAGSDLAAALAARVRPSLALVSAWRGFASPDTLDDLARAGAKVLETAERGAIELLLGPGGTVHVAGDSASVAPASGS